MLYSNENMIYPNNFEQRIGIDTIRQFVTEKCLSTLGEEKVAAMDFSTDYATIARWLEQTGEFLQILRNKEDFPVDFFLDVLRYPATDRRGYNSMAFGRRNSRADEFSSDYQQYSSLFA